jgi:hypothetical protein
MPAKGEYRASMAEAKASNKRADELAATKVKKGNIASLARGIVNDIRAGNNRADAKEASKKAATQRAATVEKQKATARKIEKLRSDLREKNSAATKDKAPPKQQWQRRTKSGRLIVVHRQKPS